MSFASNAVTIRQRFGTEFALERASVPVAYANVTFPNARNTDEARQAGSEIAAKAAAAAQRGMARKGIG